MRVSHVTRSYRFDVADPNSFAALACVDECANEHALTNQLGLSDRCWTLDRENWFV